MTRRRCKIARRDPPPSRSRRGDGAALTENTQVWHHNLKFFDHFFKSCVSQVHLSPHFTLCRVVFVRTHARAEPRPADRPRTTSGLSLTLPTTKKNPLIQHRARSTFLPLDWQQQRRRPVHKKKKSNIIPYRQAKHLARQLLQCSKPKKRLGEHQGDECADVERVCLRARTREFAITLCKFKSDGYRLDCSFYDEDPQTEERVQGKEDGRP